MTDLKKVCLFILINSILCSCCLNSAVCGDKNSPSANPSSVSSLPTPLPELTGALQIIVKDINTGNPIANAEVKLSSTSLADKIFISDSKGVVTFGNLSISDDYQIAMSANNYISKIIQTSTLGLKLLSLKTIQLTLNLTPAVASITGKIVNSGGQPIESAVISDNIRSTLSDENGNWNLPLAKKEIYSLNISKIRYKTQQIPNIDLTIDSNRNLSTVVLENASKPKVMFDNSKISFGTIVNEGIKLLAPLTAVLNQNNFDMVTNSDPIEYSLLQDIDVILISSPANAYSSSEISAIKTFVKSGKKLIVTGEWGGYGGFNTDAVNSLIQSFNLVVNSDILKESNSPNYDNRSDYLFINNFSSHPVLKNINTLAMYDSCTVNVNNGGDLLLDTNVTKIIARSSHDGIRIADTGEYGVVGVSVYGLGKIVIIGDSSIWTSDDSNNNGVINFDEKDNSKFAINIFNW